MMSLGERQDHQRRVGKLAYESPREATAAGQGSGDRLLRLPNPFIPFPFSTLPSLSRAPRQVDSRTRPFSPSCWLGPWGPAEEFFKEKLGSESGG